jgi:putative heme-binding domain-containing protein
MIGEQGRQDEVTRMIDFIARDQISPAQAFALLYSLGDGLHRTKSSLVLVDPKGKLQRFYTTAFNAMIDGSVSEPVRVEATRLLGVSSYAFADFSDWLLLMCTPPPDPALQSAAITTLGRFDDPRVVQGLLDYWQGLTPATRNHAVTVLLSRDSRVPAVLNAVAKGKIPLADLSPWQLNFLRTYRDPALSQRALEFFGPVPLHRPAAVAQFRPALRLQGQADRGREIFRARCIECHQLSGEGQLFGPDRTTVRTTSKDQILMALLEPNANVSPQYATTIVETKEGENLIGIKTEDDLPTVTLRQPGGVQLVWPMLNIRSLRIQTWSLMPDGLEQGLSLQNMADLLEYVVIAPR